jgi:hypothetical protein
MMFSFSILKRSKLAVGHFHITTQLLSVRSDDSIIYSTTSPLHHFYYTHFASVMHNDPIPAASAVIIAYITLPLRGNPIHIVLCVIYRTIVSISPTLAARTDQNGSDIPQDLFIFIVRVRRIANHRT